MHLRIFLTVVLIAFLLNLCKIDARPIKNKATPGNTSQTAGINTKRDGMSSSPTGSSSKDAGGIMLQLLKDYEDRQRQQDDPSIETPTAPTAPPTDDANVTTLKEKIAGVKTSLDAFVAEVKGDDSIWGEIKKKDLPNVTQLLEQLQKEVDPKNITPSLQTFKKLVAAVEDMINKVVEQNDDGRLHTLLTDLYESLRNLDLAFKPFESPNTGTSPTAGTSPDLNGLPGAINGDQEA